MGAPFRIRTPAPPRDDQGRFQQRIATPATTVIRDSWESGTEILTELEKPGVRAPDHPPIKPRGPATAPARPPFRVRSR